jgi:hypothetical protein
MLSTILAFAVAIGEMLHSVPRQRTLNSGRPKPMEKRSTFTPQRRATQ